MHEGTAEVVATPRGGDGVSGGAGSSGVCDAGRGGAGDAGGAGAPPGISDPTRGAPKVSRLRRSLKHLDKMPCVASFGETEAARQCAICGLLADSLVMRCHPTL